jgi:hypothetical protein
MTAGTVPRLVAKKHGQGHMPARIEEDGASVEGTKKFGLV